MVTDPNERVRDAVAREGIGFEPVNMRREISLKPEIHEGTRLWGKQRRAEWNRFSTKFDLAWT